MVEARLVVTALALMLAMFLAGVHGLRHRMGIAILALLSLAWFTVDKLFEGDVLVHLSKTHAVTTTDLVGLLGLLVVALLSWHARPGASTGPDAASGSDRDGIAARSTGVAREHMGVLVTERRTGVPARGSAGLGPDRFGHPSGLTTQPSEGDEPPRGR
jgi:hypothetical protein